jgi:hypothetical protein
MYYFPTTVYVLVCYVCFTLNGLFYLQFSILTEQLLSATYVAVVDLIPI